MRVAVASTTGRPCKSCTDQGELCDLHAQLIAEGKPVTVVHISDNGAHAAPQDAAPSDPTDLPPAPAVDEEAGAAPAGPAPAIELEDIDALLGDVLPDLDAETSPDEAAFLDAGATGDVSGPEPAALPAGGVWTPEDVGEWVELLTRPALEQAGKKPLTRSERDLLGRAYAPLLNRLLSSVDPDSPWALATAATLTVFGPRFLPDIIDRMRRGRLRPPAAPAPVRADAAVPGPRPAGWMDGFNS